MKYSSNHYRELPQHQSSLLEPLSSANTVAHAAAKRAAAANASASAGAAASDPAGVFSRAADSSLTGERDSALEELAILQPEYLDKVEPTAVEEGLEPASASPQAYGQQAYSQPGYREPYLQTQAVDMYAQAASLQAQAQQFHDNQFPVSQPQDNLAPDDLSLYGARQGLLLPEEATGVAAGEPAAAQAVAKDMAFIGRIGDTLRPGASLLSPDTDQSQDGLDSLDSQEGLDSLGRLTNFASQAMLQHAENNPDLLIGELAQQIEMLQAEINDGALAELSTPEFIERYEVLQKSLISIIVRMQQVLKQEPAEARQARIQYVSSAQMDNPEVLQQPKPLLND